MTFLQYLRAQRDRHDPVGDLARDALHDPDPDMPRRRTTRQQWQAYLEARHACDGALEALDKAWDEYERIG
jgi:uncharacterized protein YozE (UPF0346 family)